ncbi:MAG TPA: putative toxin-antitoxin system toxin component, PIN family [Edaphobacter sp.]|nr:putative toxin-antitoxin system toxin component, PIN family [Edaphobacter sp.]
MIVVLDTNVWISALQFGRQYGPPVQALEKAMREDIIATADELEEEVFRVLTEKFAWTSQTTLAAIESILARSSRYTLRHTVHICRDPSDDMFLECASLARADYLVAGDKDLLILGSCKGTRIITPLEYVHIET